MPLSVKLLSDPRIRSVSIRVNAAEEIPGCYECEIECSFRDIEEPVIESYILTAEFVGEGDAWIEVLLDRCLSAGEIRRVS